MTAKPKFFDDGRVQFISPTRDGGAGAQVCEYAWTLARADLVVFDVEGQNRIRDLCLQHGKPDPTMLATNPPPADDDPTRAGTITDFGLMDPTVLMDPQWIQQLIGRRLKQLGLPINWLARHPEVRTAGEGTKPLYTQPTATQFCGGKSNLNHQALGRMLALLGGRIVFDRMPIPGEAGDRAIKAVTKLEDAGRADAENDAREGHDDAAETPSLT